MKKISLLALVIMLLFVTGCGKKEEKRVKYVKVPYAITDISPRTKITSDMIGFKKVAEDELDGVYTNKKDVIGKYVTDKYDIFFKIKEGDLFSKEDVVELEDLPDPLITQYPDGYVLVNMDVTASTYGSMIIPGSYIDIYLKVVNKDSEIMVGKLVENIKVLAVIDAVGNDVYEDLENIKTPAQIIFAVPEEYHILLQKAAGIKDYDATLIPVPTSEVFKEGAREVKISNEKLKEFVNLVTAWDGEMIDTIK